MRGCRFIAVLIVLFGLAFAVGCGGDEDDGGSSAAATSTDGANGDAGSESGGDAVSTTPGTGFSKEEFVDQANALCAKNSAELKVKGRQTFKKVFSKPEKVAAEAMAQQVIIPAMEAELRDLKTLNVPTGDENQIYAIYAAIEEIYERLKKDATWGDFYPYTKAENLAASYGLTACGHP
jgi:hypothetical protein